MQKLTGTKKTLSLSSIQSSCDCICKGQITDFVVVTILVIGFLYIFVSYGPSSVNRPIFFSPQKCLSELTSPKFNMTIYKDQLDKILAKTAMPNKTLIIAVVNKAYVEGDKPMLDLFMDGFWLGEGTQTLRNHLLIVAVDQTAYERCKFLRLRCFKLETDGVNFEGEEMFMSNDFINMMWRRTLFLGDVLKRGYNFIFTVCLRSNLNEDNWFLYRRCSRHMMGDKTKFTNLAPKDGGYVTFRNNIKGKIIDIGSISKTPNISIDTVLFIEGLKHNFLSFMICDIKLFLRNQIT